MTYTQAQKEWLQEIEETDGMECQISWIDAALQKLIDSGRILKSAQRGPDMMWVRLTLPEKGQ